MYVRVCDDHDFQKIHNLCLEHHKFSRRVLQNRMSASDVKRILTMDVITFGCFDDNHELISFMVTKRLLFLPAWYMSLVVCKKGNTRFDAATNGIAALYDTAIPYWESHNIHNFIYVQPTSFTSSANTRDHSAELRKYKVFDMCLIPKNKRVDSILINNLVNQLVFPVDQTVRWCYKNE